VSKTEEQSPPKRTRAAKAGSAKIPPKQATPEIEEVPGLGPSCAVYMNEPPTDWESVEMAVAVEAAGMPGWSLAGLRSTKRR